MKNARANRRSTARTYAGRVLDVSLDADPRNAAYPVMAKLPTALPLQTRLWRCPYSLDQGTEGACVGFAGAHWFGSDPRMQNVSGWLARRFYRGAQRNDRWPGENYEGTSLNALLKYWQQKGLISEYRWCYTFDELCQTISHLGPVIVACDWLEECFYPDSKGWIDYEGESRGGHATAWTGINVEREFFTIQQSWGPRHGADGEVYLSFEDARKLWANNRFPRIALPAKRSLAKYRNANRPWWRRLIPWL